MGIKFRPVMGTDAQIKNTVQSNGYMYVATDSGNMYLDVDNHRISIGGAGGSSGSSSFVWADGTELQIEEISNAETGDVYYLIDPNCIEGGVSPKEDNLILNSDGRFFRVTGYDSESGKIIASLIAVSGGGGGGGGSAVERDVNIEWNKNTIYKDAIYVAGQEYYAIFIPTTTAEGDTSCDLSFQVLQNNVVIKEMSARNIKSGSQYKFNTAWLPLGTNLTLNVTVTSDNSQYRNGAGYLRTFTGIKVVEMGIEKDETLTYIPIVEPSALNRGQLLSYKPYADSSLTLQQHVYVDDIELVGSPYQTTIPTSSYGKAISVEIPDQTHGVHVISFRVSANINGEDIYSAPVSYEAAWAERDNDAPIIWIGKYDPLIVNYETSYIEFMVYDPQAAALSEPANVILYKENVEVGQMSVPYSTSNYAKWDISTIYTVEGITETNNFSISCRTATVNISLDVTTVGSRDLGLVTPAALMLNYSTAGRSNSEVSSQRAIFKDKKNDIQAILTGFNWKNNGWNNDGPDADGIDNGSYLTLANGAKMTIPFQGITLNSNLNYTFEMRFRIRNVQKYSTLIKTYAKYYINVGTDEAPAKSSQSYTMAEIEDNNYKLFYDEYGSPLMDDNVVKEYEETEGIVCKWMDNHNGICIGSQEAYFASPRGVISVRYKEDEIINISVVVSKTDGLCYIYLNGILSGADSLPPTGESFSINSNFVINSDYCDVDIYRFRIYQSGLSMPDVIHNYLSDIHSIVLYDQNQLTSAPTKLSYAALTKYNEDHPEALTMPYSVWKVIGDNTKEGWGELLPYYKGNKVTCSVSFVNPSLDKALEDGTIDEWYYYTHAPSYTAEGVEVDVQGTSSQGYPRRNFKTKFKSAGDNWVYTKGSLAGQPIAGKYTVTDKNNVSHALVKKFHMDNEYVGVNKFTWKIDYMESSGSYNTGFANLMGNVKHPLYTKHPLDDYNIPGADATGLRTTVYGFPVLVFHEYENAANNVSEPGTAFEYIGRYNMNLDKSANEAYGYELEAEQPYVEPRTRINADTGEEETYQPTIAEIAECWEMKDNQGTWCSFKYPSAAARSAGFGALQSGYNDRIEAALHFEYRYSFYGDQIDAIGADGKYDGVTSKQAIIDQIGTTNAQKSEYLRARLSNFERLFNWLDSTNQEEATGATLSTPLTVPTVKAYSDTGESSIPVENYNVATVFDSTETYYTYDGTSYNVVDNSTLTDGFLPGITYYTYSISYYNTTFNNDTAGYRLEKFRSEFDQHLDKEYCLTYFVLTELLLCYDSRGKNMMMASFGPQRRGGDYIWYPVFYDIDTQLGLNNSGAYLWDYDADVTEKGLFSTPTSVLWVNLYAAFEDDIKNKYRVLRGLNDGSGSGIVGSLDYENIAGAYQCNPTIFDSYAMKGIRPIIAIGLDEYVKYFATTTASGVGYFDTDGKLIKEASPTYAYACQGDKLLTTELLVRNRLNYIDSWWLGGSYHINKAKSGQLKLRVSGNRAVLTSDHYLDVDNPPAGFTKATYPKMYYDAKPGYTIKPFLKQYVSYFTDEVPGEPIKYEANDQQINGVETKIPESTLQAYKTTAETPNEQLNYIAGLDYISSLGDLSTSYISEFQLATGKRLLDLKLGSDVPDYFNDMINENTIFALNMADTDSGKKPLMKQMIFTGLRTLSATLDIRGSAKLQEFRALNTNIPNVYFADGAPLHTVHLPKSIKGLNLVENADLTTILTSKPIVAEYDANEPNGVKFYDPQTYRGLYIEDLTDATEGGRGHSLSTLVIDGGGLGYEAYKLLEKFVYVKDGSGQNVQIGMLNMKWTPYIQVENGEAYNNDIQYYKLNDHGMFDPFTWTTAEKWAEETLNGTIYTFDENAPKETIKNLDLLDKFLDGYAPGYKNQWGMKDATNEASVPSITGVLYVDNDTADIDEAELTTKYGVRWPNLTIQAAHLNIANIAKYVRVYENGKTEIIQLKRTSNNTPTQPDGTAPTQTYYDFAGWSTENPNEVENPTLALVYDRTNATYTTTDAWNNLQFDNNTTIITFYAIFHPHVYNMTFKYIDGTTIEEVGTPFGSPINLPSVVPYQDESELEFNQKYAFLGYAYIPEATSALDMSKITANKDMTFYAIFDECSIFENPIGKEYLQIVNVTSDTVNGTVDGVAVGLKTDYAFRGKITLPTVIDGKPVIQILQGPQNIAAATNQNGFAYDNQSKNHITHIFWDRSSGENCQLATINGNAFVNSTIQFMEIPNQLYEIQGTSFMSSTIRFGALDSRGNELYPNEHYMFSKYNKAMAFNSCSLGAQNSNGQLPNSENDIVKPGATTIRIGIDDSGTIELPQNLYAYGQYTVNKIIIGDESHRLSSLISEGSGINQSIFNFYGTSPLTVEIYATAAAMEKYKDQVRFTSFGSRTSVNVSWITA